MIKKDVTLLIQGRYSDIFINNIDKYESYFNKIIYSTWKDDNVKYHKNIEFIIDNLPNTDGVYNAGNVYYQCKSTLNGLKKVETKYVVKHRSDEFYSNIDYFINSFNKKLICCNWGFQKIKTIPYQISDHLFMGETDKLLNTFANLEKCLHLNINNLILNPRYGAEMLISLHYILQHDKYNIEFMANNYKNNDVVYEIMKEYFDVVDVNELSPFIITNNHNNRIWTSYNPDEHNAIRAIDDLIK